NKTTHSDTPVRVSGEPGLQQLEHGQILLLHPCRRSGRALEAACLDAWTGHDRANLREDRRKLLLRLVREHRKSIASVGGVVIVAVGERLDQLIAEGRLRFEVAHPALIPE